MLSEPRGLSRSMPRSKWAQEQQDPRLVVGADNYYPLQGWAAYKWVMHVDGITCSSRLEKLLSLGSLVSGPAQLPPLARPCCQQQAGQPPPGGADLQTRGPRCPPGAPH